MTAVINLMRYSVQPDSRFGAMHLQWFAAEDEGRTEDPTEHRIREARKEGKVAKSAEITSAVILLLCLLVLAGLSGYILNTILDMMRHFFTLSTELDVTRSTITAQIFGQYFLRLTVPIMATAFVAAAVGNLMQVGFLFSTKPITPDFQKITPNIAQWMQRSFFSAEGIFNLLKSLLKIAIIVALAYLNIRREFQRMAYGVNYTVLENVRLVGLVAFRMMVQAAVILLILAIPDYVFQRRQHRESLKMTKHDIKEEMKQYEGDPLTKSRLRQRMREILQSNMIANVPKADVIITNPTHFAVALEYDRIRMPAPTVTAKGQDNLALRIRQIATDNDIPIVENKPLARALYANVEIGDTVPEEYWEVVSVILAEVYQMKGQAGTA